MWNVRCGMRGYCGMVGWCSKEECEACQVLIAKIVFVDANQNGRRLINEINNENQMRIKLKLNGSFNAS